MWPPQLFFFGIGLVVFGTIQLFAAGGTFCWLRSKYSERQQTPDETIDNDRTRRPIVRARQQEQQQQQQQPPPAYEELIPRRNWRSAVFDFCNCGCLGRRTEDHR